MTKIIYGSDSFDATEKEAYIFHKFWRNVNNRKNYNSLNSAESGIIRELYQRISNIKEYDKTFDILLPDRSFLATPVRRLVIGDHGPYYEFDLEACRAPLIIPRDQLFRISDEYGGLVKYEWYHPKNYPHIKVYYQLATVKYADYIPEMFYVSPFEISDVPVEAIGKEFKKEESLLFIS
ncbi:MAG: hypothetical protein HPY53_01515 [Brevinematales bacterium]|nr:hypothetical protein [Brevinematales bacterium]